MNTVFIGQIIGVVSTLGLLLFFLSRLWPHRGPGMKCQGYAVLITGCDSGFGHHLARALDRRGFVVFAGCLQPEGVGAQTLARLCSSKLRLLKLDVTLEQDVQHAKKMVQANLPEKVVNNAGVSDWAEIEWSTSQDFQNMLNVNLMGSIRTSIALLPLVRAAKGRMVFVSSIFSFFTCLNMAAYSVSKRGLEAFADCLRVEMASFGVKVSIIQPGNFGQATNIVKVRTGADIWDRLDEERQRTFNRQYIDLANEYFTSSCRSGSGSTEPVIQAMVHALTSTRPCRRYLLVPPTELPFFKLFPLLPTFLTDALFSLSPMYSMRRQMLYAQ
ncbi:D-beta-hydroxybutyrate dehydrogenase, mitochondrial isoform X2 [Boleophthalmus pectinirostris]|uniref:D-beta-hydroxybutyrate dehydrogenase, mitochondrial isoform X2 n=1 Tax=Boleophthalmus pectinirostris TaxID=150288 RepID=UPI0024310EED|nr:D-beta-hydroxybutyrate dehydrogenase, mitochondrial isoform X2 [Boleophthalmus pectinirostris]